jgi:hypothetical protein
VDRPRAPAVVSREAAGTRVAAAERVREMRALSEAAEWLATGVARALAVSMEEAPVAVASEAVTSPPLEWVELREVAQEEPAAQGPASEEAAAVTSS